MDKSEKKEQPFGEGLNNQQTNKIINENNENESVSENSEEYIESDFAENPTKSDQDLSPSLPSIKTKPTLLLYSKGSHCGSPEGLSYKALSCIMECQEQKRIQDYDVINHQTNVYPQENYILYDSPKFIRQQFSANEMNYKYMNPKQNKSAQKNRNLTQDFEDAFVLNAGYGQNRRNNSKNTLNFKGSGLLMQKTDCEKGEDNQMIDAMLDEDIVQQKKTYEQINIKQEDFKEEESVSEISLSPNYKLVGEQRKACSPFQFDQLDKLKECKRRVSECVYKNDCEISAKFLAVDSQLIRGSQNDNYRMKFQQKQLQVNTKTQQNLNQLFNVLKVSKTEEVEENKLQQTPKFGENDKKQTSDSINDSPQLNRPLFLYDDYPFKFIYKNEKEKTKFVQTMEKTLILYNKFEHYDYQCSSLDSDRERELRQQITMFQSIQRNYKPKEKTLVLADLHRLLVFIRETKQHSTDIVICSKFSSLKQGQLHNNEPMQIKFCISLRNGLIKFLQNVAAHYNLILYTSTDSEIAELIVEHLELLNLQNGGTNQLFQQKLYSNDCEKNSQFESLRLRNINKIKIGGDLIERNIENIVIAGVNLEDLSTNIKSVVPVKPFEGKKRDHALKYLQEYLIERIGLVKDARTCIQEDFIKSIKLRKFHKLTM